MQYAHWAQAVVMNGLGRYEEARTAASEAVECMPQLFIAAWALGELVEAATRSGDAEGARRGARATRSADRGERRRLGARRVRASSRALLVAE